MPKKMMTHFRAAKSKHARKKREAFTPAPAASAPASYRTGTRHFRFPRVPPPPLPSCKHINLSFASRSRHRTFVAYLPLFLSSGLTRRDTTRSVDSAAVAGVGTQLA